MVAGVIELATGLLVPFGAFTRYAAFIASGHVFLYLAAAGGGAWSVDGLRGRR